MFSKSPGAPTSFLSNAPSIHRPVAAEDRLLRVVRGVGRLLLSTHRTWLLLSTHRMRTALTRVLGFLRFRLRVERLPRRCAGGFRLRLELDGALRAFAL